MKRTRASSRTIPVIALSLVAAVAFAAPAALAQTAAPTATHAAPKAGPDPYIEGQIAFLKAALEITPAQEAQWDKVAAVMRENNRETQQVYDKLQSTPEPTETAVQRIESHVRLAELSVREGKRFLEAFRPLYASLSKDQKATADELISQTGNPGANTAAPPPPNEPPPAAR
ncbi:MAG: Spy/CpxP family protein refolding chaperone [Alphaproteobacteria bacterium]|nr:Spy/CpxP family protein refolding chaperone [Alphaproteobacteria bacterium]